MTHAMQEVENGNRLIAEFMGVEKCIRCDPEDCGRYKFGESNYYFPLEMQYHTSWDWLMPVVEKIISIDITPAPNWLGYRVEIVPRGYVKITGFPMPPINKNVSLEGSLINAVYSAVVEFITWFNLKQK